MTWSRRIRKLHRAASIAFTALVILVAAGSVGGREMAEWVYLAPLLPLAMLLLSGLYLFVLPYTSERRSAERARDVG